MTAIRRYIKRRNFPVLEQNETSITFTAGFQIKIFPGRAERIMMRCVYHCGWLTDETLSELYTICNQSNEFFKKRLIHFHWEVNDYHYYTVYIDMPLKEEDFETQGKFSQCINILRMALRHVHYGFHPRQLYS